MKKTLTISIKQLKKELLKIANEAVKRDTMREAIEVIEKDIKKRTVEGKSSRGANLPELAESTKRIRRHLGATGKLTGPTVPGLSNVTRSGKMINSVTSKAFRGKAIIKFRSAAQAKKMQKLLNVTSKQYGTRTFKWFVANKKNRKDSLDIIQVAVDKAVRRFNNK